MPLDSKGPKVNHPFFFNYTHTLWLVLQTKRATPAFHSSAPTRTQKGKNDMAPRHSPTRPSVPAPSPPHVSPSLTPPFPSMRSRVSFTRTHGRGRRWAAAHATPRPALVPSREIPPAAPAHVRPTPSPVVASAWEYDYFLAISHRARARARARAMCSAPAVSPAHGVPNRARAATIDRSRLCGSREPPCLRCVRLDRSAGAWHAVRVALLWPQAQRFD